MIFQIGNTKCYQNLSRAILMLKLPPSDHNYYSLSDAVIDFVERARQIVATRENLSLVFPTRTLSRLFQLI